MALQFSSDGGTNWATYTEGTTVLPNTPFLRFRDTALAIDTGAATFGPITLNTGAWSVKAHVVEGDDTLTAGTGVFRPLAKGVTYAAGRKPTLANDDTGGVSFTITDSANEMGEWAGGASARFEVYFSGIIGASTTLHVECEIYTLN